MRTVYLGTSSFAATVLERLAASEHRPSLVITRPDAPRGRGRKLQPPPVAETARALGIAVIQPERLQPAIQVVGGEMGGPADAEPEITAYEAHAFMAAPKLAELTAAAS